MRKFATAFFTVIALLAFSLPGRAERLKEVTVEYSADSSMESGGISVASKVFHAANRERIEQETAGVSQTIILRTDKKLAWVLMPEMKMYMETGYDALGGQSYDPQGMDYTLSNEGSETVNGVKTQRYKMIAVGKDGKRFEGRLWLTTEGIMMKIDAESKGGKGSGVQVRMELRNLKIGGLDKTLFEVPAGYSKMQDIGGTGQ